MPSKLLLRLMAEALLVESRRPSMAGSWTASNPASTGFREPDHPPPGYKPSPIPPTIHHHPHHHLLPSPFQSRQCPSSQSLLPRLFSGTPNALPTAFLNYPAPHPFFWPLPPPAYSLHLSTTTRQHSQQSRGSRCRVCWGGCRGGC